MRLEYEEFKLAIYCTVTCLDQSFEQLANELAFFQKHLKVSKVYIENHRGNQSLNKKRLLELKRFYESYNMEVAGGITPTLGEGYRVGYERIFGGICYTDHASRARFQDAVVTAASVFDEVIFDDFFFTNCGCEDCLALKGERSWEEFRLELMTEVSENLIMKPARAINPKAKMVIKFPNWNEAYQASGYNTELQPQLFDGIYTGTETRDPAISQQHIPRYASYSLMRWMENLKPGFNGGGWFDNLDCTFIDYYLEQSYLTAFSKAKELTLFCYSLLKDSLYIPPLGFQLEKLDALVGQLGKPVGMIVYEPHHAKGEDHLYDYLGMLGIPLELTPHFPETSQGSLLITANAAKDEHIIARMKQYLRAGGHIMMTSGFLNRMQGKGVEDLTSLRPTGNKIAIRHFAIEASSCTFETFCSSTEDLLFPILDYSTNSTWQLIVGLEGHNNIPLLMFDNYSKGRIYTLAIPDNYHELQKLPNQAVTTLRRICTERTLPYRVEGKGNVGLFSYDNDSFVFESFGVYPDKWNVTVPAGHELKPLTSQSKAKQISVLVDKSTLYEVKLNPSSFQAFQMISIEE